MKKLDWRKDSDYDYIHKLSPQEVAWEFLRRSTAYKECYLEYKNKSTQNNKIDKGKKSFLITDPEEQQRILDEEDNGGYRGNLSVRYARPWHLYRMIDPDMDYPADECGSPRNLFFKTSFPEYITEEEQFDKFLCEYYLYSCVDGEYIVDGVFNTVNTNVGIVAFDLRSPLGPQIKKIKEKFKPRIEELKTSKLTKKPKIQANLWKQHLRVLDAHAVGVSTKEIVYGVNRFSEFAWEKEGRTAGAQGYALLKSAQKMADSGYKSILTKSIT